MVEALLANDANPNQARTDNGGTPVYIAAQNGRLDVVKVLLANGADLNQAMTTDGATPVFIAAHFGHTPVCRILAAAGADFATRNARYNNTPAEMARRGGHHETAAWLDSVAGFPAFRIAVVAGLAAVELVLAIGRADPDDCAGAHRAGVIAAAAATADPGPLIATARLALRGWSPANHHLHHAGVRRAVWAFMLTAQRVDSGPDGTTIVGLKRLANGSALPIEMWLAILGFVLRPDWPVPPLRGRYGRAG